VTRASLREYAAVAGIPSRGSFGRGSEFKVHLPTIGSRRQKPATATATATGCPQWAPIRLPTARGADGTNTGNRYLRGGFPQRKRTNESWTGRYD
jgi:hypothetical protein